MRVSPEELIQRIRTAPELADESGNFIGKQEYEARVNRFYPGGVDAFESALSDEILIQKWTELVGGPATVDDAEIETAYRERNEKTSIRYFLVPSSEQEVPTTISDDELRTWYDTHQDRYRRQDGRMIRYVTIEREQAGSIEISDDEVRAAYEADTSRFTHPEQRRARHILFRVDSNADEATRERARARAEETLARIKAGEDFGKLAGELSQDTFSAKRGGDLDWFARGAMVPPFDEAVFSTPPGQLCPVVQTQYGYHVIEVTGAREAGTLPLEDVRPQLVAELRIKRAEEAMLAQARRLRDRIESPADFDKVAAEAGLEVSRRFVNEQEGMREIGASNDFRTAVLDLQPGQVSEPLRVSRGVAIVVVDEMVPASVAPLDQIEDRVRSDLLNARAEEAAVDAAEKALARHPGLDRAAKALGREVKDSGDLTPGQALPGSGGSSPEMREALFGAAAKPGERGVVEVPAGALAYEIVNRVPFDPQAFAAARDDLRKELLEQRRLGLRRSMVDQLSRQSEIVINQQLVDRLDGGA